MAVLAPQDWHPPRDHSPSMDPTIPRQRSSPSNDPQPNLPIQPYPYPVQQAHGAWTPSPAAQPFYPSYYQQNQHQHQQPQHPYPSSPSNPYFDPQANAQLAQWAYQQMMYSQQQQIHAHQQQQRSSSQPSSPADYYNPSQLFSPFPSGTPPPHSHHPNYAPQVQRSASSDGSPYNGFHPYRRPNNTRPSHSQEHQDWRSPTTAGPFQPPYARGEASASSTSVNSSSSHGGGATAGSRQRTSSIQGQGSSQQGSVRSRNPPPTETPRARTGSGSSNTSRPSPQPHPHHRTTSSSSSSSSSPRPSASPVTSRSSTSTSTTPATASSSSHARPARPSPLSQGTYTAAEKRMSRDDSDLAAMLEGTSIGGKTGGIKGRLRRALSLNAAQALQEEEEAPTAGGSSSSSKDAPASKPSDADAASTATVQTKKKGRAASLFNSRLNASTDNISLSSTMSSASVVIRKIGSIGKLARRNSLAGITSLFKDKNKSSSEGGEEGGKKKKKKDAKGAAVAPSVSHAIAELDRGSDWSGPEMTGLSPAAKLARQHTLKSNAEAAAKARAEQAQQQAQTNGAHVPAAWDKNTTTRAGESSGRVGEDGTRVVVEEDESDDGHAYVPQPGQNFISDGWDDDEIWDEDAEGEEDVTIRVGVSPDHQGEDDEVVAWATNIRRSVERRRTPAKGILKGAENYSQESYNGEAMANPAFSRIRSNSYNSRPGQPSELGPLARMPSPDPDHIDGLHRHPSHSSSNSHTGGNALSSPPLLLCPSDTTKFPPEKERSMFMLSNSSAPALSTMPTSTPTLTHRSATSPAKRLVFANNLSVYDTFSSTVYDRRSEPATWSRLTPALAQRIKEELNSYKMEEMEVHACSRMHTQFFI